MCRVFRTRALHGFGQWIFFKTPNGVNGCPNVSMLLYWSMFANSPPVYHVHWLRAKAMMGQWSEEVDLLLAEFQWTVNFFDQCAADWDHWWMVSMNGNRIKHACYAARQQSVFSKLQDQWWTEQERYLKLTNNITTLHTIDSSLIV